MLASKGALAALGLLAVALAGGTGWLLLSPGKGEGAGVSRPPTTTAEEGSKSTDLHPDPVPAPIEKPKPAIGPEAPGPDDERDIGEGPEGGFTAEEILAAAAKGDWVEVERMLSVGGSDDPRVTDAVLAGLSDDRWRFKIADLAKHLKDPRVTERLLEIAGKADGNEYTRSAALKAAAQRGGPGVVEAVAAVLRDARPGSLLANNAALALGTLGTPEAAQILVEGLRSAAGKPGAAAFVEALGRVREPGTLARLGEILQDGAWMPAFRAQLAGALGRTGDPAVVNDLLKAAREAEDEDLRFSCYRALALVGTPDAARELLNVIQGAENDRRLEAARAISESTSKAVAPLLEEALKSPMDPVMRSHLVVALGKSGGPSSVEVLGRFVADEAADPGLRGAAAKSLGQIGDAAASPILVEALERTPSTRENAPLRSRFLESLAATVRVEELPRLEKMLAATPEQSSEWFVLRQIAERLRRVKEASK